MPPRSHTNSEILGPEGSGSVGGAPLIGELRSLGDLHILRRLGSGGMSEVFLAYHPNSRRMVAVKILADHLAGDRSFVRRFAQEASLSRKLAHPNLVRGLACGRDPATRREFMVMEFVDGPTAQEMLERQGPLPVAEAVRITLDIARALEYVHSQRYVHRDIKPDNILVAPDGSAKLADLGVAKSLTGSTALTSLDQGIGTPYYMPWEQTLNAGLVDARSDLFALGATLYHLVTGRVPFPGDTDRAIARRKQSGEYTPVTELGLGLPVELDRILGRMLARDPRQRFPDASQLIDVLTASGLTGRARSQPNTQPAAESMIAPTRADLAVGAGEDTPITPGPVWLIRFRGNGDVLRRHRATTADVIRWFREGLLPESTEAARPGQRRYRPLCDYREFRALQHRPADDEASPAKAPRRRATGLGRVEGNVNLQLAAVCVTGLLSVVLSAVLLVWMFQHAHGHG